MDLTGLPFFTGIAIYCYEGAGMILSLEASIAKDYRSRFKVCLLLAFFSDISESFHPVHFLVGNLLDDGVVHFIWRLWVLVVWGRDPGDYYAQFAPGSNAINSERVSLFLALFHVSRHALPRQ